MKKTAVSEEDAVLGSIEELFAQIVAQFPANGWVA